MQRSRWGMLKERLYFRIAVANCIVLWYPILSVGMTWFLRNIVATIPLDLKISWYLQDIGSRETIPNMLVPIAINYLLLACLYWHLESIAQWSSLDKMSVAVHAKPEPMLLGYYKPTALPFSNLLLEWVALLVSNPKNYCWDAWYTMITASFHTSSCENIL